MNNKIIGIVSGCLGVGVGGFVAWRILDKRYEAEKEKEIENTKRHYESKIANLEAGDSVESNESEEKPIEVAKRVIEKKPDLSEYAKVLKENNYIDYSKSNTKIVEEIPVSPRKAPYVITPNDFMSEDNYNHITLTYYSDGVLVDENKEVIEDADSVIGKGSLTHFGEYEDDSVYVRDEVLKIEYEILYDQSTFAEVSKHLPKPMEV